jgi:ribosomal protein L13E
MEELIAEVAQKTGLDRPTAERAVGIILSLVRKQGAKAKVEELFQQLPGADELASRWGGDGAKGGGLLGMLGGGLMGGPLVAVGKLQAAGLSMEQIRTLGKLVLDHARQKAGDDLVRQVASSIPGLSGYL